MIARSRLVVQSNEKTVVAAPPANGGLPLGLLDAYVPVDADGVICEPGLIFSERIKIIGGVGKTLRWEYTSLARLDESPAQILVFAISVSESVFDTILSETEGVLRDCEFETVTDQEDESLNGLCTSLVVDKGCNYATIMLTLRKRCHFKPIVDDESRTLLTFDVGLERFDRSKWNFFCQSDEAACPRQSWHKWNFSWLDEHWRAVPSTWSRLAANLDDVATKDAPLPLSIRLAEHRINQCAREVDARSNPRVANRAVSCRHGRSDPPMILEARRRALERSMPEGIHIVTGALTKAQSRELLMATMLLEFVESLPADVVEACGKIHRHYLQWGYVGRLFGPYAQQAEHVGHGLKRRMFHKLAQYNVENLPSSTLSRLYVSTGELVTKGRIEKKKKKKRVDTRSDASYRNKLLRGTDARFTRFGKT